MSTNSRIGIRNSNDTIRSIYCNWDGYPEYTGKILVEHYKDINKINQLLNLGNISILGPEIGEKQDFYNPTNEVWVLAYGRDRGEDSEGVTFPTMYKFLNYLEDYNYLYYNGDWYLVDKKDNGIGYTLQLVTEVLNKEK